MLTRAFALLGFYASKDGSWLRTPRYHPEERISKLHRGENLTINFIYVQTTVFHLLPFLVLSHLL